MRKFRLISAILVVYLFFFISFSFLDSLGFIYKSLSFLGLKNATTQTSDVKIYHNDPVPDPPDPPPPPRKGG